MRLKYNCTKTQTRSRFLESHTWANPVSWEENVHVLICSTATVTVVSYIVSLREYIKSVWVLTSIDVFTAANTYFQLQIHIFKLLYSQYQFVLNKY